MPTVAELAATIRRLRPPAGVQVLVVAIDGCGGAGKSTFARQLGDALDAPVVSTDEFASWSHPLDWHPRVVAELLQPLAAGQAATYRRSEWGGGEAIVVSVDPAPILILEGVSSSRRAFDGYLAFRIWIETGRDLRLQRGMERDGEHLRDQWLEWMASEDTYVAEEHPAERADVIVPGDQQRVLRETLGMTDWIDITRRNARSVQTTIGWIFWDPGAVARYEALGLPGPLGYIASRAAPLAPAGPDATIAAFGSISPLGIRLAFDLVAQHTTFEAVWAARDDAVLEGLREHAPAILEPFADLGTVLWPVVEQLPAIGRVFFAAHLRMPRPADPVLSGWHAVNCIREWRGDTHWALVVAAGLDGVEAGILHNAWVNYERDWLPKSRGVTDADLARAWAGLEARGLARDGEVTDTGAALRQHVEDETDRSTTRPWELLGVARARRFAEDFESPCELLLRRVDVTVGPNYQPGSRSR